MLLTANSIMNRARSSVMRSAYVSSQRSPSPCPSSSWSTCRRRMPLIADMRSGAQLLGRLLATDGVALGRREVALESLADLARAHAGLDGEDALHDQLLLCDLDRADALELVRQRQPEDV